MKKFLKGFSAWVLFVLALMHTILTILSISLLFILEPVVKIMIMPPRPELELENVLAQGAVVILAEILISALCWYGWWRLKD